MSKPCQICGNLDRNPSDQCRPCANRRSREWREENRERHRKYHREYAQRNRQHLNAQRRQNYAINPELKRKQALANQVWKANQRGKGTGITTEQWEAIIKKYDYKCVACNEKADPLCQDHIIPISKGRVSTIDNIQPLCRSCNTRKMTNTVDYRPDSDEEGWQQSRLLEPSLTYNT